MKHKRLNRDGGAFNTILIIKCDWIVTCFTDWCALVRQMVEERIASGEPVTKCREVKALKT